MFFLSYFIYLAKCEYGQKIVSREVLIEAETLNIFVSVYFLKPWSTENKTDVAVGVVCRIVH